MASHARIFNLTRRYSLKHKQALRAVDNCACAWVEFGISVRDLTLAESIAARNKQATLREPLPFVELPGIIFRPAVGRESATRAGYLTIQAANQFAEFAMQG